MSNAPEPPPGFITTLQSLLVAFVIAMAFRGFIVEGYVIPTGSMGPTLMGRHVRLTSPVTGSEFPVGLRADQAATSSSALCDPMLGPKYLGTGTRATAKNGPRIGDRILVVKTLYPFFMPDRFDVVVFKNPTNPTGDNGNYIKRLIGLPNEAIWIVDGDVFATDADAAADLDSFRVQRKPEHVQRTVWQPVFASDFVPGSDAMLDRRYNMPWIGWTGEGDGFRRMRAGSTGEPVTLVWDQARRGINDWTSYNQPAANRNIPTVPVSDVRVCGAVTAETDGLRTELEIGTRRHVFSFVIDQANGEATVRYRSDEPDSPWRDRRSEPIAIAAGSVADVEFWHVDQRMAIYLDGERVVSLDYEWAPEERLRNATGLDGDADLNALEASDPRAARLEWTFSGASFALERLRVDRDLYYRDAQLDARVQLNDPKIPDLPAFATHPDHLGILGPDHFMMLGDNSQASLDSRLWGSPAPLVVAQIDDAPFVVHRRLLLGKAWMVYFPAPVPYREGGKNLIPDFGRLRFIR